MYKSLGWLWDSSHAAGTCGELALALLFYIFAASSSSHDILLYIKRDDVVYIHMLSALESIYRKCEELTRNIVIHI